jgi:hypothetical protein
VNATAELPAANDRTLGDLMAAEWTVLVLTKTDCGYCAQYKAEIGALRARGLLTGTAVGVLTLDQPGALGYKRANPWLAGVKGLPYTLIYHRGQRVDDFAASKGSYLRERLAEARAAGPGRADRTAPIEASRLAAS